MGTNFTRGLGLVGMAGALAAACSSSVQRSGSGGTGAGTSTTASSTAAAGSTAATGSTGTTGASSSGGAGGGAPGKSYPGTGFIVHEWGTDTIVVGSDGSLQRGLHHEEEDLPSFVYDRIKAGGFTSSPSVEVKMETPVTYFYSDQPLTATVSVGFPHGVFTQWYPASAWFTPQIVGPQTFPSFPSYRDPVFDLAFPFGAPQCRTQYGAVANGMLDWGTVDVLARDASPALPDAPLAQFSWSLARNVASNPVHAAHAPPGAPADEYEKFLFYRGLGDFPLPVTATAAADDVVRLHNAYAEPIGQVFVMNVAPGVGAFTSFSQGIPAGGDLQASVPSPYGLGIDDFSKALAGQVTAALDATGLYHDEAVAMVSTWKRQWFQTPGVRLLYLIPQSWTDTSIPLSVTPAPQETVRVMMIRIEVITPGLEQADTGYAAMLADASTVSAGQAHFTSLGRFAEPRLRRALALLGQPSYGDAFLATLATASTVQSTGE